MSFNDGPWKELYRKFQAEHTHPERMMEALFTDPTWVRWNVNPDELMWGFYWIASDMQDMECDISFYDIFTPQELFDLWQCFNFRFYAADADWTDNHGLALRSCHPLLRNILECADAALDPNNVDRVVADLRFGHDGNVIPLCGYTNQDGIIKTNNYQRTSASVGLSPRFLQDHLTFDINVKGSYEDNKPVTSSVVGAAIAADPTRPIHATYPGGIGCGYYTWMNGDAPMAIAPDNALALLELDNRENKVTRSIGNMAIDYKIHGFEDLRFNLNLGYDVLKSTYDRSVPQFAPQMYTSNQKDGTGLEYTSKQNKRNTLLDFYTNYTHTFAYEQHLSRYARPSGP